MHLRTGTLALAFVAAVCAHPQPRVARAGAQATPAVRGTPVQPLPFLASGPATLQTAAAETGSGLTAARHSRVLLHPARPATRVRGTKRTAAPAHALTLHAAVLACRLGTPPPVALA